MAAIAQTIAIVDRSGKVVSTSKQLKNVFKEAKSAYLERKAEISAGRKDREDRELRKAIKAMSLAEESRSDTSRSTRPTSHSRRDRDLRARPPTERHYSGSSARSGSIGGSPRSPSHRPSHRRSSSHTSRSSYRDGDSISRSAPVSPGHSPTSRGLVRSHTDMDLALAPRPQGPERANTTGRIDMDLAYGEYHPESISPVVMRQETQQLQLTKQQELGSLVTKAQMLLDEVNCAQHSVKAIVAHLQKNPDAMAAVALTLAEISNIASKMAPGALSALKLGAPSVFALLAAPEFLIAVGVGLGVTIVMFGGYKIIKKIQSRNAEKEDSMDEMLEIGSDIDRIEHWRRGIADVETASVATSVEGEFMTPMAAASTGYLPRDPPRDPRLGKVKGEKKKKSKKSRKEKSEASSMEGSRTSSLSPSEKDKKALVKVKKPSPLRRMFKRDEPDSSLFV